MWMTQPKMIEFEVTSMIILLIMTLVTSSMKVLMMVLIMISKMKIMIK